MRTCEFCHKELVNANAYEDGLYSIIGQWLCEATCIDWFKFNPNIQKPEVQYGMMMINNYTTRNKDTMVRQIGEDLETANFCLAIEETEEFTLDLHVLQEQGDPVRCDQDMTKEWNRSASDVLKQISSRVDITEFNKLLEDNGIRISPTNLIQVSLEERKKVWENWAEASFEVVSCRKTSYPLDGDELVYCVELCDGTPICRAKEFPDCG